MRHYLCVLLGVIACLSYSCIEEFVPDIEGFENSIVVEGQLLEGKNGARVELTNTFAIDEREASVITGSTVSILDDQGNSSELLEMEPGVYVSDTSELIGIPGRSYQLLVTLPSGVRLESEFSEMVSGAQISDVRYEFEQKQDNRGNVEGVQIYLDASDPGGEVNFYRWEYEETWLFRVPYPAGGIWNSLTNLPDFYPPGFRPQTCYASDVSSSILIKSTDGLVDTNIKSFPIEYISTRGNELSSRYSILVKQYTTNSQTFEFWRQMKNVTEELGGLFDPIPTEVRGNIRMIGAENTRVIGIFSADGYSEKRIFIDRGDLPPVPVNTGFATCEFDTIDRFEVNSNIIQGKAFVEEVYGMFGNLIGFGMSETRCTDCRLSGDIEKPDFWD